MANYCIIVHGGAFYFPGDMTSLKKQGVLNAVKKGYAILQSGGNALDAVELAVTELENYPYYNAGIGSALTINGTVEMDAGIMDGKNLHSGAIGCVKTVKNPIQLARKVMENTKHNFLVAKGAEDFALSMGVEQVEQESLVHSYAVEELEQYLLNNKEPYAPDNHDTVGAVALDSNGNIAAATSTGGRTGQLPGRVGDSPILGSGFYSDNTSAGVSTTGIGEAISTVCLSHRIVMEMDNGRHIHDSLVFCLELMLKKTNARGGAIAIDKNGEMAHYTTEPKMPWASIRNNILKYGCNPEEVCEEKYELIS